MRNISIEERVRAVKRHLEKGESCASIAASIGIGYSTICNWCRNYESMGMEAFEHSGNKHYSLKFKTEAVAYCLHSGHSERDTCKKFKIPATSTLHRWILLYNGHELGPSSGGKGKTMAKGRKTTLDERIHIVEECVRSGLDYDGASRRFGVSYQQVYSWVRKHEAAGVDGLIDKRGRSKPMEEMSDTEKPRAENRILKAQVKRKELENLFLKKLDEIERRRY